MVFGAELKICAFGVLVLGLKFRASNPASEIQSLEYRGCGFEMF